MTHIFHFYKEKAHKTVEKLCFVNLVIKSLSRFFGLPPSTYEMLSSHLGNEPLPPPHPHYGKRIRISSCFRFHYMNVNGFKWWRMDSNGMFMPCPSGAGQLAIYLGSAQDTNQLPATTLGKNIGENILKIHRKNTGKTLGELAIYLGLVRTPTNFLAGCSCQQIWSKNTHLICWRQKGCL